jgi:nitrogenase molybdenum-iron protein alpha/beta subunit
MVPLIHGPIGCACNNRYFIGSATKAHGFPVDLFITSTDLSQSDVIFGGEDKLTEAIIEIDNRYAPEIIAIFNTCAPGIIGDDIDGIARTVQSEVRARILPIHSEGYGHFSHYAGYRDAYDALMHYIVRPPTIIRENTINIVGDKNDYLSSSSMNDIRSLMKTLSQMGIKLHAVIPGGATVQQIEDCASVRLNVMKCDSMAIDFCSLMKEKYGTEYTKSTIPIGIEATVRWIEEIASKLNLEDLARKVIDAELKDAMPFVEEARSVLKGKTVAVTGNYARAIAFLEFAMELGMKPSFLGLYGFAFAGEEMLDRLCQKINEDFEIVVGISTHEEREMTRRLKPDLFLADFREKPSAMELGIGCGDVPLGQQPQLGFEGVKFLSQCMIKWIHQPFITRYGHKCGNGRTLATSFFINKCGSKILPNCNRGMAPMANNHFSKQS